MVPAAIRSTIRVRLARVGRLGCRQLAQKRTECPERQLGCRFGESWNSARNGGRIPFLGGGNRTRRCMAVRTTWLISTPSTIACKNKVDFWRSTEQADSGRRTLCFLTIGRTQDTPNLLSRSCPVRERTSLFRWLGALYIYALYHVESALFCWTETTFCNCRTSKLDTIKRRTSLLTAQRPRVRQCPAVMELQTAGGSPGRTGTGSRSRRGTLPRPRRVYP